MNPHEETKTLEFLVQLSIFARRSRPLLQTRFDFSHPSDDTKKRHCNFCIFLQLFQGSLQRTRTRSPRPQRMPVPSSSRGTLDEGTCHGGHELSPKNMETLSLTLKETKGQKQNMLFVLCRALDGFVLTCQGWQNSALGL